jgi:hypothetical protein
MDQGWFGVVYTEHGFPKVQPGSKPPMSTWLVP